MKSRDNRQPLDMTPAFVRMWNGMDPGHQATIIDVARCIADAHHVRVPRRQHLLTATQMRALKADARRYARETAKRQDAMYGKA